MPDPAYNWEHQQRREALLPDAYNTPCPRCGKKMLKGQALDLGHSTDKVIDPNAIGDRIEHEACNRKAGLLLGQTLTKFDRSRIW